MDITELDNPQNQYFDSKACLARLKELRIHKGYSQKNMAEKIGMEASSYNKFEKGITSLTYDRIVAILKVLEVSLREFFGTNEFGITISADYELDNENKTLKLQAEQLKLENKFLSKKMMLLEEEILHKDQMISELMSLKGEK